MHIRNIDIASKYGVSSGTTTSWLKNAKKGKNNLTLIEVDDKQYIADTLANHEELTRLYNYGRAKVKSEFKKEITASKEFLSLFTDLQLIEFISDLAKGEINLKFSYFGEGAKLWDDFYFNSGSKILAKTISLTNELYESINYYLVNNKYNIFDIACGNGLPIVELLSGLKKQNKLNKYYSIDISKEINELSQANIEKLIPDNYGGCLTADVENPNFVDYFYQKTASSKENKIVCMINTLSNFNQRQQVLHNVALGMEKDDLFIFTFSIPTKENTQNLKVMLNPASNQRHLLLPELLGIEVDTSTYKVDYNSEKKCKYKTFKATKEYSINFPIFNHTKKVHIPINTPITIWRAYTIDQKEIIDELDTAGLEVLSLTKDQTAQTAMIICRLG